MNSFSTQATPRLRGALAIGEGQQIEFKESARKLDREFVAFSNALGGDIYLGVTDSGMLHGISVTNRLLSELHDVAQNCDPAIAIDVERIGNDLLRIRVPEGHCKPYQCKDGFFLRQGANTQKLRSSQIRELFAAHPMRTFDTLSNSHFSLRRDLSVTQYKDFLKRCGIETKLKREALLENLELLEEVDSLTLLRNAGVLLFAEKPQRHIPECTVTCVKYAGTDRIGVEHRIEAEGGLSNQIELSLQFVAQYNKVRYHISGQGQREEVYRYPPQAIREAIVNAAIHRDYAYQHSHTYVSIYDDRLEFESPGGLPGGLKLAELGTRSVRRNPLLADLLFRAGYGEKLGSGFTRIRNALEQNNNPPLELTATNFFSMRFLPRIEAAAVDDLTIRQARILDILSRRKYQLSAKNISDALGVSSSTVLRDLHTLTQRGLVESVGVGRATGYQKVTV